MIIVLCGFMGSGKSTMLKRLTGGNFECFDLDQMIVDRWGAIEKIVQNEGWDFFRECEQELLGELLAQVDRDMIIAAGGGAITSQVIESAGENIHFVWLNTSFETCWKRIKDDLSRPLVQQGREELQRLYQRRVTIYQQAETALDSPSQKRVNNTTDLIGILDEAQRKV